MQLGSLPQPVHTALTDPDVRAALRSLQQGRPILVFDGDDREGETDLFYPAQHATAAAIRRLRQDAGGLVFVAIGPEVHAALGLPFLHDLLRDGADRWPLLDALLPGSLPYDARSSFSLTVNHRGSFTGITDADRSLTVKALGKIASLEPCMAPDELQARFAESFRIPGHVALCSAAPGLLTERQGHTELAVALARLAGVPEAIVGAEMLDPEGDNARSVEGARGYAAEHDLVFVTGAQVQRAWGLVQEGPSPIPAGP